MHDYASISGFVTNLTDFWDSSKQWNGRLDLASPVDSNLFPDISQTNTPANITRLDSAAYTGYAAGAMIVGETRKILGGSTAIDVNFNSRSFGLEVSMLAYDKAEAEAIIEIAEFVDNNGAGNVTSDMVDTVEDFLGDVVQIRANDVGFSPNGELVGTPKFEVSALTDGTADPLIGAQGDLEGGFYGPAGEISALHGKATQGQNTIIWGTISAERQGGNIAGTGGGSPGPSLTTPFPPPPALSGEPSRAQQIFTALNDSNNNDTNEDVEIDVFGDNNLIVTVHITQGGFAMSEHYANFSAAIPVIHTFLDNDETWAGNIQLTSPANSSNFPGLSQTAVATNITLSGTATYRGLGMGAMQVSGIRKLLLGSSIIEVDFANSDFELALGLAALDSDEITDTDFTEDDLDNLLERDVVFIEATDIGFGANGALTGTPEFTIDTETLGTAVPLENQTGALQGGFRGPAGEILILSGSVTNNSDSLIWGMIANE